MTCGWCLKELSIRGWYKRFKIHFDTGEGALCGILTAKRRKTLTTDRSKVTCQVCRRKLGPLAKKTVWEILGSDDAFLSGGE